MESFLATAAYLTPAEGIMSRFRLAEAGIESRVESLDLVTWFWHLSLAFQGVKLVVRTDDAERASEILDSEPTEPGKSPTTRCCTECDENLPGDWFVCWRCGTDSTSERDESFFMEAIRPARILNVAQNVEYLGLWLVLATILIWIVPAVVFPFLLLSFVYLVRNQPEAIAAQFIPEDAAANPDTAITSDLDIDTNRRALASAMFGLVWFPPLTLYSLWLLLTHDDSSECAKIGLWRRAAWAFNFIGLLAFMSFLGLLVASLNDSYFSWWTSRFVAEYLETSSGFAD